MTEILKRALDIFIQQLKLREIEVLQYFTPDLPLVMADASRLEQVFINMLINARDAIEEKWTAAKTAETDALQSAPKHITLKTYVNNGNVVVEIIDTGCGIPTGVRNKIFEPFFTTKRVGKGTGLGLSISYGIIQDCGGTITVDSEPGKGTRFVISLPIAPPEEDGTL
jgi:histidine kinase